MNFVFRWADHAHAFFDTCRQMSLRADIPTVTDDGRVRVTVEPRNVVEKEIADELYRLEYAVK